ncbi:hypothetical protein C3L33_17554, partial [Rhododendron williamsianum]
MMTIRSIRPNRWPMSSMILSNLYSSNSSSAAAFKRSEPSEKDPETTGRGKRSSPSTTPLFSTSSFTGYDTGVKSQKLMNKDMVIQAAQKAKEAGSTRFCMGAAWRETVGRKTNFNQILEYVKEIREMGMEVCCTLGMLEKQQALELKAAGLTAYNHNLDTSREYYPKIITTRSYDERLETLTHVREAGINVCSGGIIGLGEAEEDRVGLLHTLATLPAHPESVPINALLAVKAHLLKIKRHGPHRYAKSNGSAVSRKSTVLHAGAGFVLSGRSKFHLHGEKLLTTPNNDFDADQLMFKVLGLIPKAPSFSDDEAKDLEAENCEEAVSS